MNFMEAFSTGQVVSFGLFMFFARGMKMWSKGMDEEFDGLSPEVELILRPRVARAKFVANLGVTLFATYYWGSLVYLAFQSGIWSTAGLWLSAYVVGGTLALAEGFLLGGVATSSGLLGKLSVVACPVLAVTMWFV